MKTLYLVDANTMFFRAFFAINPSLKSPAGLPTNALYGFLSMTVKLLKEIRPDYIVYCFDRPEPSFRSAIDPEYKAHRAEMPEELVPQVPYVKKITDALGIPRLEMAGFEADDLIGTLSARGRAQQLEVVIVSGDKDFAQLIGPHTTLYDTMKEVKYDPQGVVDKWGVAPEQFIDFLAIVGDTSDNIPGVKGIGKVGAQKLLKEYKTLQNLYDHLDEIPSASLRKKLAESRQQAFMSQKLVTIVQDVPLSQSLEDLKLRPIHPQELRDLLTELDFKTFLRTLLGDGPSGDGNSGDGMSGHVNSAAVEGGGEVKSGGSSPVVEAGAGIVSRRATHAELQQTLQPGQELWGLWTERGFYLAQGNTVYQVSEEIAALRPLLEDLQPMWCGYDLKTLWTHLALQETPHYAWDQMLAAYVVRPGTTPEFVDLVKHYLGPLLPEFPDGEQLYRAHLRLRELLTERLAAANNLQVLTDIELPLLPVLYRMERRGILIHVEELRAQGRELGQRIDELEQEIVRLAGESFNIASPKQLAVILFERLGLPKGRKTKTGYSTNSDVLEKLRTYHPICEKILEYRELTKLKSTYVDALPEQVDAKTGRIHTHFRQALTTTGRLSSTHPNLQNIPIRTEKGSRIRRAFVAESGKVLLSCDYSQIELRILAHITGDDGLCRAFREDLDIHAATASEIFNVPFREVNSELRRLAKAVNFGLAYGQGVYGLAESLQISRAAAKEIIENYFKRFPKVAQYMKSIVEQARKTGYVETVFGRRRYLEDINSSKANLRAFAERAAINAPIQGTASDLVKLAMIEIDRQVPLPLLLQVHDELIFEGSAEQCHLLLPRIRGIMESAADLKVPLKVNASMGPSWDQAH